MINPYCGYTDTDKQTRLAVLTGVYERLVLGEVEARIDDDGSGSVVYVAADLPRLERLILLLQRDLGLDCGAHGPRAVAIGFGPNV